CLTSLTINLTYTFFTSSSVDSLTLNSFPTRRSSDLGQADSETIQTIVKEEIELYIDKLIDLSGSIHPAMAKEDVEIVQQTLSYIGYYDGNIDRIYGCMTQKAVEM